jgi:phenylalanine-4-hydroxylase
MEAEPLRRAIAAGTLHSARYSSGIEVRGVFSRVETGADDQPIYIGTTGPTQLAFEGQELPGHGRSRHPEGFGSPVGRLKDMVRCLSECSTDELLQHGIWLHQSAQLEFASGITLTGHLEDVLQVRGRKLIYTFSNCSVTGVGGQRLYRPEWGPYDMAAGVTIASLSAA